MKKNYIFILTFILFFPVFVFSGNPFRFVFLTDMHISTETSIPTEDLQWAVKDVNTLDSIDFAIVGGDISDRGDKKSLEIAKQNLDKLKIPYFVIGGNHDFSWKRGVGETDFNLVFGDNKFTFKHNGFRFIGFTTTPEEHKNEGHVLDHNIEWMKDLLKKNGHKKPVFIITHYPLQKGDVDNSKKVTAILKEYNVSAILNGHYHRNLYLNCDGIQSVVNRTTMRNDNKVGGYSIISVADSLKIFEKKIGKIPNLWLTLPLKENK